MQYAIHSRWECVRAAGVPLAALTAVDLGPIDLENTLRYHRELVPIRLRTGASWRAGPRSWASSRRRVEPCREREIEGRTSIAVGGLTIDEVLGAVHLR